MLPPRCRWCLAGQDQAVIEKRVRLKTITVNYRGLTDSSAGKGPAPNPLGNFRWINKQRDVAVRQLIFYKEMISLFLFLTPGPQCLFSYSPIGEDICPMGDLGQGKLLCSLWLSGSTTALRTRLVLFDGSRSSRKTCFNLVVRWSLWLSLV